MGIGTWIKDYKKLGKGKMSKSAYLKKYRKGGIRRYKKKKKKK